MSQMANHQEKNGHVYVVEDEDVEVEGGDVEVEDKDVEDEDVVAKVDQDRIKGALVVDSRLPGHGSAGGKDKYVIDWAYVQKVYLSCASCDCGLYFLFLTLYGGAFSHGAKLSDFCG